MNIKKLNEELRALLEGDVVSFADFKRRKEAEKNRQEEKDILDEIKKEKNSFLFWRKNRSKQDSDKQDSDDNQDSDSKQDLE